MPIQSAGDFLKLAAESGLFTPQQCRQLQVLYQQAAVGAAADAAQPMAQWLVTQKHLSRYQAKVLLSGKTGPFMYGAYKVVERLSEGPLKGCFRAVHISSDHPVLLHFLSGAVVKDPRQWLAIAAWLTRMCLVQHPRLHCWYEWVDLGSFKFLVMEDVSGRALSEVLKDGRVKAPRACHWLHQAAEGLEQLHRAGITHGQLRPENLWLESSGRIKVLLQDLSAATQLSATDELVRADYLAPELANTSRAPDAQTDVYAAGCTLYYLLAGRVPFPGGDYASKMKRHASEAIQPLDSVGVPANVSQTVAYMMAKNPAVRFKTMAEVASHLAPLAGDEQHLLPPATASATVAAYSEFIQEQPWRIAAPSPTTAAAPVAAPIELPRAAVPVAKPVGGVSAATAVVTPAPSVQPIAPRIAIDVRPDDHRRLPRRKKRKSSYIMWLAILGLLGGGAAYASIFHSKQIKELIQGPPKEQTQSNNTASADTVGATDSGKEALVSDDGTTLWASPTDGQPIDFSGVPPESLLTIVIRPSELMASAEGTRLVQALGPEISELLPQISAVTKMPVESIDQLLISLHGDGETPRPAMVVRLLEPIPTQKLVSQWDNPEAIRKTAANHYFKGEAWSYYIPNIVDEKADAGSARQFTVGSVEDIEAVVEAQGVPPLPPKGMEALIRASDSKRLLNIFFVPQFLRSTLLRDGREFYFGSGKRLLQPIDDFLGDGIRCGLLSAHLDDGFYMELMLSTDVSRDRKRLASDLRTNLERIPSDTEDYLARVDSPAYWRKVALRLPKMVQFLSDQARVGVENNTVVVNAVLPTVAAHNLAFGSEMLLASLPADAPVQATAVRKTPSTVEELLAAKTAARVDANSLEFVLRDIAEDVKNSYPDLPFEFDIRILGEDLQKDSITRNQSVTNFKVEDKPLSEILTALVLRCNPITTVTKPNEKDQKLVWAIGDDPDQAGRRIVLITTRDGAANRNIELPQVFRIEP